MKVQLIIIVVNCFTNTNSILNYSCGVDKSLASTVYEGLADIETYPWLGVLVYPINQVPVTTTVVLITKQLVLGAALDIDRYPKFDFRARARVVLGHNCTGPRIGIKDYTYHPDYAKTTYSALTIIQLDSTTTRQVLQPICPPPLVFKDDRVYAMMVSHKCSSSMVRIYKMKYVNLEECRQYYRKFDLDVESMWPTHFACAQALHGGDCVWKNGAVLVIKQKKRWKLVYDTPLITFNPFLTCRKMRNTTKLVFHLGFGIYGPGCRAPARFLDYGMHHEWVRNSIIRIGRPAITRTAPNRMILRRSTSTIQRFGECDPEELRTEIYTDTTDIINTFTFHKPAEVSYNLTILANMDYNCIVLEVVNTTVAINGPQIYLRRWCTNGSPLGCYDFNLLQIDFYIHITFYSRINYKVSAYGQEIKLVNGMKLLGYVNKRKEYPEVFKFDESYQYSADKFVAG